jgi:hypothetical protein
MSSHDQEAQGVDVSAAFAPTLATPEHLQLAEGNNSARPDAGRQHRLALRQAHHLALRCGAMMANMVSIGDVAITYQPALEQLLVLLPEGTADFQAAPSPT